MRIATELAPRATKMSSPSAHSLSLFLFLAHFAWQPAIPLSQPMQPPHPNRTRLPLIVIYSTSQRTYIYIHNPCIAQHPPNMAPLFSSLWFQLLSSSSSCKSEKWKTIAWPTIMANRHMEHKQEAWVHVDCCLDVATCWQFVISVSFWTYLGQPNHIRLETKPNQIMNPFAKANVGWLWRFNSVQFNSIQIDREIERERKICLVGRIKAAEVEKCKAPLEGCQVHFRYKTINNNPIITCVIFSRRLLICRARFGLIPIWSSSSSSTSKQVSLTGTNTPEQTQQLYLAHYSA